MKKLRKKLTSWFMVFVMIFSTFAPFIPMTVHADSRIEVTQIEATSNINTIAKYAEPTSQATFNITKGTQARFAMGKWMKKIDGEWKNVSNGSSFTAGTYQYQVQVRIDGEYGLTHVLSSSTTVKINGTNWSVTTTPPMPMISDKYSYTYATSPEIVIAAGNALLFEKKDSFNVPDSVVGTPISSYSISSGVSGGTTPYTFSKTSGPSWITVSSNGTISGTPTAAGSNSSLVVRVTDASSNYKEITLSVGNTSNPSRVEISKIEATSDISSIAKYAQQAKKPIFNITQGTQVRFPSSMGQWMKKSGSNWVTVSNGATFDTGTYKYQTQIRIDGEYGLTHMFSSSPTVKIDGNTWVVGTPNIGDTYSFTSIQSPEIVINTPPKYTATWDFNTGTSSMNTEFTIYEGEKLNYDTYKTMVLQNVTPPANRKFSSISINGNRWDDEEYTVTGPITLRINWEYIVPTRHAITLDFNGGTSTISLGSYDEGTKLKYDSTKKLVSLNTTPPVDKEFDAFEIDGIRWDSGEYTVIEPITLKILWKDRIVILNQHTVIFDSNGGTGTMSDIIVDDGSDFSFPTNGFSAPNGKEFDKWEVTSYGTFNPGDYFQPNSDITVKAIWKNKPPVAHTIIVQDGAPNKTSAIKNETITIEADEPPTGKEFDKWVVEAGTITLANANSSVTTFKMPDENVRVKATYKNKPVTPTTYKVTFINGDNGKTISTSNVTSGAKATKPSNPTMSGYNFVDWYTDSTYRTKFNFNTTITKATNVYALFRKNKWFKDVPTTAWFYGPIRTAQDRKIIYGYNEDQFAPHDKITRGQIVTILWRLEKEPIVSDANKFSDVKNSDYFMNAIKWAAKHKIVSGYGGTTRFGPNDNIIRQDIAAILNNYAKYKGLDSTSGVALTSFADYNKVKGNYAEPALKWAVKYKVVNGKTINGKKYISPHDNATRAEATAMLVNFMDTFKL